MGDSLLSLSLIIVFFVSFFFLVMGDSLLSSSLLTIVFFVSFFFVDVEVFIIKGLIGLIIFLSFFLIIGLTSSDVEDEERITFFFCLSIGVDLLLILIFLET